MKKISLGVAATILSLGAVTLGLSTPLAMASSGSEGAHPAILTSGVFASEPRLEIKIEKDAQNGLDNDVKIEIKREADVVQLDEKSLAQVHEIIMHVLAGLHMSTTPMMHDMGM